MGGKIAEKGRSREVTSKFSTEIQLKSLANSHTENVQSKTMGGLAEKISGNIKAKKIFLEVTQYSWDAEGQIQLTR